MLTSAAGITELLRQIQEGNPAAETRLVDCVYPELQKLARRYMAAERPGHTLRPTALVHEAYVRIFRGTPIDWVNRAHFLAIAARQMRRVLIDHGRGRAAARRAGITIELAESHAFYQEDWNLELVDALLDRLKKVDPIAADVVEKKFFAGMSDQEVAKVVGVSHKTVRRHWDFAKAWLKAQVEALA